MINECEVLINNDFVTVVRFDDIEVQLPSIHRNAKTVRVMNTGGKYIVVSNDYIEPESMPVTSKPKRKGNKKTTVDNGAEETAKSGSANS